MQRLHLHLVVASAKDVAIFSQVYKKVRFGYHKGQDRSIPELCWICWTVVDYVNRFEN